MKTRVLLRSCLGLALGSALLASAGPVTFQVNLSVQAALGHFDPNVDSVFVSGSFNEWSTTASWLLPDENDPDIWVGTYEVGGAAGSSSEYKFVMTTASGTVWEGAVGPGGAGGNRVLTVAEAAQELSPVFFNNITDSTTVSADVTFRIDLSVQTALGAFDPATGSVSVAGEFNGWSASAFPLVRDGANPDLWVGTVRLSGAAASALSYKFVLNGGTWEGNVGPNGAQNRSLTLQAEPQVLEVVFFNNVAAVPTLIPVTFQVDLGVLIARGGFDPATGTVSVSGDVLNNWSTSASILERSGPGSTVWAGTFDISSTEGGAMLFKYVLNDGATWESTPNRPHTFASTEPQTLDPVYFNDVSDLGAVVLSVAAGKGSLSWTAGPLVRLQRSSVLAGEAWQDVPDTQGQGAALVDLGAEPAFFRLVGP